MSNNAFIIKENEIVVYFDGDDQPTTVFGDNPNFEKLKTALKTNDWTNVRSYISVKHMLKSWSNTKIVVKDGSLFYDGNEIHNSLAVRIVSMVEQGFAEGIEPMVLFLENLLTNPSKASIAELYGFMENGNMPITEDGHFLAYKKVTKDFKDCHTKQIDNSPGSVVTMDRVNVNDNRYDTCSHGLHFCSRSYLGSFGGDRILLVKINPRDVVSIPVDYNNAKGRCCRYTVLRELAEDEKIECDIYNTKVDDKISSTVRDDVDKIVPQAPIDSVLDDEISKGKNKLWPSFLKMFNRK